MDREDPVWKACSYVLGYSGLFVILLGLSFLRNPVLCGVIVVAGIASLSVGSIMGAMTAINEGNRRGRTSILDVQLNRRVTIRIVIFYPIFCEIFLVILLGILVPGIFTSSGGWTLFIICSIFGIGLGLLCIQAFRNIRASFKAAKADYAAGKS